MASWTERLLKKLGVLSTNVEISKTAPTLTLTDENARSLIVSKVSASNEAKATNKVYTPGAGDILEDFEGLDVGVTPDSWHSEWTYSHLGAGSIVVASSPVYSGSRSARLTSDTVTYASIVNTVLSTDGAPIVFYCRAAQANQIVPTLYTASEHSSSTAKMGICLAFWNDEYFYYNNGGSWVKTSAYTMSTWYKIKYTIHDTLKKYDLEINDVPIAAGISYRNALSCTYMMLYATGTGSGAINIDNIDALLPGAYTDTKFIKSEDGIAALSQGIHSFGHSSGQSKILGAIYFPEATAKNPPIDADKVLQQDSADSDRIVISTWTQVKAFLKTYFDTLYNLYVHPNHSGDVTSTGDGATAIASGVIVNDDINASAAIVDTKLAKLTTAGKVDDSALDQLPALGTAPSPARQTAIVNAEIDASAGIVDTKLAQITTASKVSGAAITLLTSLPSGAGKIPIANLPSQSAIRARLSDDQTLTLANTWYILAHATEDTDVLGEYATDTYRFTAGTTGIYLVIGQALLGVVATLDRLNLAICKNSGGVGGAGIIRSHITAASGTADQSVRVEGLISLSAADYVEIHARNISSAGDVLTANTIHTFFEVIRIA